MNIHSGRVVPMFYVAPSADMDFGVNGDIENTNHPNFLHYENHILCDRQSRAY